MAEDKTRFTHTDGYVAPAVSSNKKLTASENLATSRPGEGFFLDGNEEEEDIVKKIHHWRRSSGKDSKTKHGAKHRELHGLFSEPTKEEKYPPEMGDTDHPGNEDIHLNRLLDDYMLGEKGDRIMKQMEDMTTDDSPSSARDAASPINQQDLDGSNQKGEHKSSLDLDALVSMVDFEKYIAEN